LATVAMSYHVSFPVHDYLIIGEEETIVFDDGALRDGKGIIVPKGDREGIEAPIPRQDAEFFAAIREKREPAISGRSVRPAMAALQAAQDSLDARLAALGEGARHPEKP
jgi:2-hydroxy-4-carboxymuconate semialdehyde hemiacetal dehydrogenase